MSFSLTKKISLNNQISSGSRSSLLSDSIDFKLSENEDSISLTEKLKKKYTCLLPDINGICATNHSNGVVTAANGQLNTNGGSDFDGVRKPKVIIAKASDIQLEWKQMRTVGAGLANMGNTCFMNSVLQCLSYLPPLVNYLLYSEEDHASKCKVISFCMTCELQKHVKRLYQNSSGVIKPVNIYQRLRSIAKHFQFGRQEDAHEFLRYVIEHMWKSCITNYELANSYKLDAASKETTIINQIFGGYMRSQIICILCKEKSNTFDYFMDFILDIKNANTLAKALEKYVQPETLENENAYKCQHCKKKVTAKKRFSVQKAPIVATFQFKRFEYNRLFGGKITKHIVYPEILDLRPYMSEIQGPPIVYRLNAVLVHLGATSNSGHYYCYVRSSNNIWYLMDDARVSQVSMHQVLNQEAYILFYVRKNTKNIQPSTKMVEAKESFLEPTKLKPAVIDSEPSKPVQQSAPIKPAVIPSPGARLVPQLLESPVFGPNQLDTVGLEPKRKWRKFDEQYNEDYDKGKTKKIKRHQLEYHGNHSYKSCLTNGSGSVDGRHKNPFQSHYDRYASKSNYFSNNGSNNNNKSQRRHWKFKNSHHKRKPIFCNN